MWGIVVILPVIEKVLNVASNNFSVAAFFVCGAKILQF